MAKSLDPDEMACYKLSHLDLHILNFARISVLVCLAETVNDGYYITWLTPHCSWIGMNDWPVEMTNEHGLKKLQVSNYSIQPIYRTVHFGFSKLLGKNCGKTMYIYLPT